MIYEPINDQGCLGQLSDWARELARTTLVEIIARRLGSREAALAWIRSKPQLSDLGEELYRVLSCDVAQRLRLFADNPNCIERANDAMMLLEVLEPATPRALVTINKPKRHTALVEKVAGKWEPLDLFSRANEQTASSPRNSDARGTAEDVLKDTHEYVGKPLLGLFLGQTGTHLADALGTQEQRLYRKRPPAPQDARAVAQADSPRPGASNARRAPSDPRPRLTDENSTEGDQNGREIDDSIKERDADATSWRW